MGKSLMAVADGRYPGSGGVIAVTELVPRADKHEALLEALRFVEDQVRRRPECLSCGVFEATDKTGHVLYVEQWESNQGLDAHIRSGLYLRVLHAIELAAEAPKISFHEVYRTRSMELIMELRNPG
jgi:quinol monooxygenase YgiN